MASAALEVHIHKTRKTVNYSKTFFFEDFPDFAVVAAFSSLANRRTVGEMKVASIVKSGQFPKRNAFR